MDNDTIFALATARGRAGVAVIRISGPEAFAALGHLTSAPLKGSRGLRILRDADGQPLDQALVLTFPEGHSFTGDPVVELHTHGSPAVVEAVLTRLSALPGLRQAEAGEFTQRALENGCLDLAEVEGLADLIDAETEAQRRQAMRVFQGDFGARVGEWRSGLLRAVALIEATIDFADEEVPVSVDAEVHDLLETLVGQLEQEAAGVEVAERIREGFEVAIIGAPNVGKSTLLNRLAGRDAAITSEYAGTTRDVLEVQMNLRGLPVTFIDTAGLRETQDPVEQMGIERGKQRADEADIRVYLSTDGSEVGLRDGDIVLQAKADDGVPGGVSGKTGAGVDALIDHITAELETRAARVGLAMRLRHQVAMVQASEVIRAVLGQIDAGITLDELAADELRTAVRALDSLIGKVDVEDILGEIFSSFCIGK